MKASAGNSHGAQRRRRREKQAYEYHKIIIRDKQAYFKRFLTTTLAYTLQSCITEMYVGIWSNFFGKTS